MVDASFEPRNNFVRKIDTDSDTFPEHAYREPIDENITDLLIVKSSHVIVTIDFDSWRYGDPTMCISLWRKYF